MEQLDFLAGRIRDLSVKAYQNGYVTHTDFLTASELADVWKNLAQQGVALHWKQTVQSSGLRTALGGAAEYGDEENVGTGVSVPYGMDEAAVGNSSLSMPAARVNGAELCVWGGWEDADRNVLCFLPDYLDRETFLLQEQAGGDVLACIRIAPVNAKFADALTHRDYLGALMNLGIERDQIGDILTDETQACVFVIADIAPYICKELLRIRHTSVRCEVIPPSACAIRPQFEEMSGSIASERLDAVLAMVFRLPRGKAQQLVENESVSVGGRTAVSAGANLKPGDRVSVRGFGKFIYEGVENTTKKGRLFAKVRRFV